MRIKLTYALYGFLFGLCFPIFALLLEISTSSLHFTIEGILKAHEQNVLIYMIDSAPIFLGLFALLGGISKAKAEKLLNEFRSVAFRLNQSNTQFKETSDEFFEIFLNSTDEISKLNSKLHNNNENLFKTNNNNVLKAENLNKSANSLIASTKQLISLNKSIKIINDNIFYEISELKTLISTLSKNLKKINSIGTEIKTLSINSSIEAQRYGSIGTGFRVIASQIKSLSEEIESLNKQTEQSSVLTEMEVENINEHMLQQNTNLQSILSLINKIKDNTSDNQDNLSNIFSNIELSIDLQDKQKRSFNSVSSKIENLNNQKESLLKNMQNIINLNSGLIEQINHLK